MRRYALFFACFFGALVGILTGFAEETADSGSVESVAVAPSFAKGTKSAYIIPIREQIDKPMFHFVRRGVKEAMAEKADILILDMKTPGGELWSTLNIMEAISNFPGKTVTYINDQALSAGAFISYGTREIYMSPMSVIGASAPVAGGPVGMLNGGEIPETMDLKVVSMIRAKMRSVADEYHHNSDVIEAMIDAKQVLEIDGEVLCPEGELLTLTNEEAARLVGENKEPLLSLGTVGSLEELYSRLEINPDRVVILIRIGVESIASWISSFSALLIMVGGICLFIEYKTPGFGIFGIVGISAFVIYFIGNNISGLGGIEWLLLFVVGILLLVAEIFFLPGSFICGAAGLVCIFVSLLMGMADFYPGNSWFNITHWKQPIFNLGISFLGCILLCWILVQFLPKTSVYAQMVSSSASGEKTDQLIRELHSTHIGKVGKTISVLRPGGKADFGGEIIDVVAQSGMVDKDTAVRIIGFSGTDAIVEEDKHS